MQLVKHPERFITELSTDQIYKLFPDHYYDKYAPHLKFIQFEKKMIRHSTEQSHIKIIQHQLPEQTKKLKKVKMSSFETVDDLILKNYQQFHRMSQYAKELGQKLATGSRKSLDSIKTKKQNLNQFNPEIFIKVKQLQDFTYDKKIQQFKKKKIKSKQTLIFQKSQHLVKMDTSMGINSKLALQNVKRYQNYIIPESQVHKSQNMVKIIDKQKINHKQKYSSDKKKYLSTFMNFSSSIKQSKQFFKSKGPNQNIRITKLPMYMRNASTVLSKNMQQQKFPRDLLQETKQLKKRSTSLHIQKRNDRQKYKLHMSRLIKKFQGY